MHSARTLIGTALLWVALSALAWVPTASAGPRTAVVAVLGFAAFAAAVVLLTEGLKRSIVEELRRGIHPVGPT